ncbi:MAG: sulfurtransferase, partial [Planctomycetaceae bacterium]
MSQFVNIAAYKFVTLNRLEERREHLRGLTERLGLKGTILLSEEGLNSFLAGTRQAIDEYLSILQSEPEFADLEVKESFSDEQPFSRMLVRIKNEIIAFGVDGIDPREETSKRITAKELKQWYDEGRPFKILDTRNDYEIELGTFKNAIPIGVNHFRDFPEAVEKLPDDLRDEPIVTFCTGGIRCEKAGPFMESAGFNNIYQLDGGILKYFEECGGEHYDGDCFVFDKRVALDPQLEETDTELCYACLAALTIEDQASTHYVPGESCPKCFKTEVEAMEIRIERRHEAIVSVTTPLPGSEPYENRRPMNVSGRFDGVTVEAFLKECYTQLTDEDWQTVIAAGQLFRDDKPIQTADILRAGNQLVHVQPDTVEPDVNAHIQILHEDDLIVVINKPAPLPMHPCGRYNKNSLVPILNEVYRPERLRPMHRLDANTTGVVVLGRTRRVASAIQPQFESNEVKKVYLAQVVGHPDSKQFRSEADITAIPETLGARSTTEEGLKARTDFVVREYRDDGTSIIEAMPKTGRTNQIRLHLANLGFPIVGDPVYSVQDVEEKVNTLPVGAEPMRLHSLSIDFRYPSGREAKFAAPEPDWLTSRFQHKLQSDSMNDDLIYKICPTELWGEAQEAGVFTGAPIDLRDGYIHFSTAGQLAETAGKHFADQHNLLLLTIAAHSLGDDLKWEPSRGGALFPHLYAPLQLSDVV